MTVKWTLTDPSGVAPANYTFEINPSHGGIVSFKKLLIYNVYAAADGSLVALEGRQPLVDFQFVGDVLSQAQFTALELWYQKRNRVVVTDDLGQTFNVYIHSLAWTRKPSTNYPWFHSYTCDSKVIQ